MAVLIATLIRLIAPLIRLIASRRRSGGSVSACMRPSQVMGRYQKQCHGRPGCKRTHLMREAISLMREAISLMREAISLMREAIRLMREALRAAIRMHSGQ